MFIVHYKCDRAIGGIMDTDSLISILERKIKEFTS